MQERPETHVNHGGKEDMELKYPQKPPIYEQNQGLPTSSRSNSTFEQIFRLEKPRWNDLWAGILFILTVCGFAVTSGLAIHEYAATKGRGGGITHTGATELGLSTNLLALFASILCFAFIVAYIYFTLARAFTKQFIWITGVLQIVVGLGSAIFYFARHHYSAAVVFSMFSMFYVICFISWIPRIPFSVLVLQTVMDVAKSHGRVFTASFIGALIMTAFGAWFSITLTAVYVTYQPGDNASCYQRTSGCSTGKVVGLIVFLSFAGYWISEWLRQTLHTTIAGVYGTWYFCSQKPVGMPSGATRGAFRRAVTYSFGSISFGSLIVSIIQLLRQAETVMRRAEKRPGHFIGPFIFCILGLFLGILDWAVHFINHYAFSHIALYGTAYIPAAKATWRVMKDRGMDELVTHCVIDLVLTMGSLFVAYLCALLAYLYLAFSEPAYNSNGQYTSATMALAFLIGMQICNIFVTPLKSGTATFFVATAWDPQILMSDFPDLWTRMISVYPHVQQAIHA